MEWQPIETAPKDGTTIIATSADWLDGVPAFMHWSRTLHGWFEHDTGNVIKPDATHWMPLPAPPSGA